MLNPSPTSPFPGKSALGGANPNAGAGTVEVDGRRRRRERGRLAVLDATIDLALANGVMPTADEITETAGVSSASLFRYFDTLDDLRQQAVNRYFERYDPLMSIADIGVGPLEARVDQLVASRDAFYRATAPVARLARRQAQSVEMMSATLANLRIRLISQIADQFAAELDGIDPDEAKRITAVIAVLTSFEAWDQLAMLPDDQRRCALRDAVIAVLRSPPAIAPPSARARPARSRPSRSHPSRSQPSRSQPGPSTPMQSQSEKSR